MSGVYFSNTKPILTCGDCPFNEWNPFAEENCGFCSRIGRPVWDDEEPDAECGIVNVPTNARVIVACPETFPTPHRKELNDYMRGWNTCLRSVMQSALQQKGGSQE